MVTTTAIAAWRAACWLLLLLAAFAGAQYLRHGDWSYVAGAGLTVVACAGCILRQAWARPVMRGVALGLALWAVLSGAWTIAHWGQFAEARAHALAMPDAAIRLPLIEQMRRTRLLVLVLKALLLPLLAWLAWQLGRPPVRQQFRARPGAADAPFRAQRG